MLSGNYCYGCCKRNQRFAKNNVVIPLDFLGTEDMNFALDWDMFFLIFFCYLTNFDETNRRGLTTLKKARRKLLTYIQKWATFTIKELNRVKLYYWPKIKVTINWQIKTLDNNNIIMYLYLYFIWITRLDICYVTSDLEIIFTMRQQFFCNDCTEHSTIVANTAEPIK